MYFIRIHIHIQFYVAATYTCMNMDTNKLNYSKRDEIIKKCYWK